MAHLLPLATFTPAIIGQIHTTAYYMELGLRMKKKKHGQLLSVKDMFKRQQKHVNRRSNRHA
jgi:hypothetical protein